MAGGGWGGGWEEEDGQHHHHHLPHSLDNFLDAQDAGDLEGVVVGRDTGEVRESRNKNN